jgi:hypothetical protein
MDPKVLPIELDWRFGIVERLGRVRMKELMDFHHQSQDTFRVAMRAWKKEAKEFEAKYEDADGDHLIDERDSIESLMDRGHTFGIVGLYTFLERFLNLVIEHLRAGGAPIPDSQQGLSLHKMRDYLAQHAKIDMNRPPFDWTAIERLQERRNCIVHADGWITDDFVIRLRKVGLRVKPDRPLRLPKNCFEHTWKLVNETYRAVYKECEAQFGFAKQQKVWFRPTRKFTSDELRKILQEATEAGVAARKLTTEKLMKVAKQRRRDHEDGCGFVWLTLDPKLLKHIHNLNIPNVNTSYNTKTIVEDFNLYLTDVRDYQRMSASLDGMRAAAAILKRHGINSRIESLAD